MNSINNTARLAGLLYLLMVPLGLFGIVYVPSMLIVPGDAAATVANIGANESLFRLSIVSALLVQLVNIGVVLLLYKLLKPVHKTMARLMVMFILLAVPMAMLNEVNHAAVLALLESATSSPAQAAFFLDLHEYGIIITQIFWGLWLFPMGYLVYKSGYIPRIIGILLMIGCFGYLMDSFTYLLLPDFGVTVSEFTFLGEVLLPLWLVIMGVNTARWAEQASASAGESAELAAGLSA